MLNGLMYDRLYFIALCKKKCTETTGCCQVTKNKRDRSCAWQFPSQVAQARCMCSIIYTYNNIFNIAENNVIKCMILKQKSLC